MQKIEIATAGGTCPAYVFRPAGKGPWPAVLVYMDGVGMRPAMHEIAARIATAGYLTLLPDYYYRSGAYAPMNPHTVFANPDERKVLMEKYLGVATQPRVMSDTKAFLDWFAAQPDVKPGKIGTTGYCLGGLMSMTAAGTFPDRIAATASYHGGRLATDDPLSPHLLAPKIRSRVYVGGAIEDASFDDAQKARLEKALTDAGVTHTIETYPARHGWVPTDMPVYDAACAEKHWQTLLGLYAETLAR